MSDRDPLIGEVLGDRYEVQSILGKGGMGTVYEGRNVKIGKRVAIKVLSRDLVHSEQYLTRFQREARAAGEAGHPHIVDVYDLGESGDGLPYIVMEHLEGEPLQAVLDRDRKLAYGRAVDIAGQVLHALSAVHELDIVHRDLKPENIFMCRSRSRSWNRDSSTDADHVKVLDFGISLFRKVNVGDSKLTQTGAVFGTPYFMSPEQATGSPDIDARSDVYAVGALLYTMLSGRRPFAGDNAIDILSKVIHADCPRLGELEPMLPVGLVYVVEKAMDLYPDKRYQSAGQFMQALRPYSATESMAPSRLADDTPAVTVDASPPDVVSVEEAGAEPVEERGPGGTEILHRVSDPEVSLADEDDVSGDGPEGPDGEEPRADEEESGPGDGKPSRAPPPLPADGRTETPGGLVVTATDIVRTSKVHYAVLGAAVAFVVLGGIGLAVGIGRCSNRGDGEEPGTEILAAGADGDGAEGDLVLEEEFTSILLEIEGSPSGAKLYMDGEYIGRLPYGGVMDADGVEHVLRAEKDGYQPSEIIVRLDPGREFEEVRVELAEAVAEPEPEPDAGTGEDEPTPVKPPRPVPPKEDPKGGKTKKAIKIDIPDPEDIYK